MAKLDVSVWENVKEVIDNLPEEFSNIDILVNNAGLAKGVRHTIDNVPVGTFPVDLGWNILLLDGL